MPSHGGGSDQTAGAPSAGRHAVKAGGIGAGRGSAGNVAVSPPWATMGSSEPRSGPHKDWRPVKAPWQAATCASPGIRFKGTESLVSCHVINQDMPADVRLSQRLNTTMLAETTLRAPRNSSEAYSTAHSLSSSSRGGGRADGVVARPSKELRPHSGSLSAPPGSGSRGQASRHGSGTEHSDRPLRLPRK